MFISDTLNCVKNLTLFLFFMEMRFVINIFLEALTYLCVFFLFCFFNYKYDSKKLFNCCSVRLKNRINYFSSQHLFFARTGRENAKILDTLLSEKLSLTDVTVTCLLGFVPVFRIKISF